MSTFNKRHYDEIFCRWVSEGLSEKELQTWQETLMYQTREREEFAEWIKTLRDPAWALSGNHKKDTSS